MKYKNLDFGKSIKKFRENNDLSQETVAFKSNTRVSHISSLERGVRKNPRFSTIVKILNALNVSFDDLFAKKGE